jgi:predicted ATP-grasp superfamily ATP-dependent carboligase
MKSASSTLPGSAPGNPSGALDGADLSTPAVVLKFDPNVMHHGGLGAIRTLGRLGVPVYGVHEGPWAPAANSRYLHGRWFWRPSPDDTDRVQAGLLRLAERIGRKAVLIPTDDAAAIFLAENGGPLRQSFLFPSPPRDLPRRLAGKYSMYQMCQELGVPCPQAVVPQSPAEARAFATRAGFPLIAKLTMPWTGTAGGGGAKLRSTSIVRDFSELNGLRESAGAEGAGLMLQEFIPGGAGHDWFFHGYCDADSVCRPAFTGVKERSYPPHTGLTSLGHSVPNTRLRRQARKLLARLSYRGIVDLDLRLDARDGEYKLLDFNPRLGAQFRLFRDAAGMDVVLAQYLDLTGGRVPVSEQITGRTFWVESYDPLSALSYWRHGELGLRSWLASVRTVDETAWFARDDLRPFGLMCVRMACRLASYGGSAASRRVKAPRMRARDSAAASTEPRYRPGRAAGGGRVTTSAPGNPAEGEEQ